VDDYGGTIPAHAAKRIAGEVSQDTHYFSYWWDKRARVWHKVADITDIPDEAWKRRATRLLEGKAEFRILDFAVE